MSKKAVLILEDAVFIREMEKKYLRKHDFDIAGETSSESEGVSLYQQLRPDLVIVDLALQQGQGTGAIRSIRAADPGARILVVTSYDDLLEKDAELKAMVGAVLHKPFTEEEFVTAIKSLL